MPKYKMCLETNWHFPRHPLSASVPTDGGLAYQFLSPPLRLIALHNGSPFKPRIPYLGLAEKSMFPDLLKLPRGIVDPLSL